MAKPKPKKRAPKKKKTNWYDLGNEVIDGVHNTLKFIGREAMMRPDSLNQRAMEGVGNAMVGVVGAGAITGHYAGKVAAPVIMAPVNAAEAGLEAVHNRVNDSARFSDTFTKGK